MAMEGEKLPQANFCICLTVTEEEHCHSLTESSNVKIPDGQDLCNSSRSSDCSVDLDLEYVILDIKVNAQKTEKICRICHIEFQKKSGMAIELGCSCKGDLASAHKHCAETWFKIKGNNNCEICGSTAMNLVGIVDVEFSKASKEPSNDAAAATGEEFYCYGHRLLCFLLACMLFVLIISWLLHFVNLR